MILALDIGNTRLKWGLHNGEHWLQTGSCDLLYIDELTEKWPDLPHPTRILGCNVAGENIQNVINMMCMPWRLEPQWLTSKASQLGVNNHYDDPSQLGADRWASLIAAKHLHAGSSVVVNLGTAMTVDALGSKGDFLGGIIVPGFMLMREALAERTADLGLVEGTFSSFPTNTADAIYTGVIQALTGALTRMEEAIQLAGHGQPVCILSGGDAHVFRPHVNMKVKIVDNLVLEGLIRIARE